MKDPHQKIFQSIQPYLLPRNFMLNDLPEKDLELLRKRAKEENRKRGDVLFKQGTYPAGVFWLVTGKAKIFQELGPGQRQTLYIYSDGDLIGYRQFIAEESNPVSAVLLEDSIVRFIPGETYRHLLTSSPFFSRNVISTLAREFTVWMNRMTVFKKFPVRRRLVLALLMLHELYRQPAGKESHITMTRTELAEYVGATLETVVRGLNTLKTSGLVQIKGRQIKLTDPMALLEILKKE